MTRHPPLPGFDGAATYMLDILCHLKSKGVAVHICWLGADSGVTAKAAWAIPDPVTSFQSLHVGGALRIHKRYLVFPAAILSRIKVRCLHLTKQVLLKLGIFAALRRRSKGADTRKTGDVPPATYLDAKQWSALPSAEETVFFAKCVASVQPDFVIINYCWLAPLVTKTLYSRSAVLTNDVVSERLERPTGENPDASTAEGEAALLKRAAYIIAISQSDADKFQSMRTGSQILVCPKAARVVAARREIIGKQVLFVGGDNEFNREGIVWFLENCLPLVAATHPDIKLRICGNVCNRLQGKDSALVELVGRVDDLDQEYSSASVVIVPLLRGSGIKIKVVEAASHSKAIVTTPVGLQGLGFLEGNVYSAETPKDFAEQVSRLLENPMEASLLGTRCSNSVERCLAPDRTYHPLADLIYSTIR